MSESRRVAHPILRLSVVGDDGDRESHHRVFCRHQRRSIAVGTCCACMHCDRIADAPSPAVECTIPQPCEAEDPEDVGALLHGDAIALDHRATVGAAVAALAAQDRRSLPVVDDEGRLIGVVHEASFVARRGGRSDPRARAEEVSRAMSSPLAIHECMPVRVALRLLAAAHLREAAVVASDGRPIGTFRDVDGLRFVARARR